MQREEIQNLNQSHYITYLLTPRCRVLLEKLTGLQLVKKFPAFHGTRRFITALTSVRHLSLSRASSVQSIYPHPTSCRSILILSTHLRLGLPSGLFPFGFPTKTLYSHYIIWTIKTRNTRWAGNVTSMEHKRNVYKLLFAHLEVKIVKNFNF